MNIKYYIIGLLATTTLLMSCKSSGSLKLADKEIKKNDNSDSIELTTLVRNIYEWHETKYRRNGFPFKFKAPNDSIFTGVDWDVYAKEMEVFKTTNFFSKDFFTTHRTLALSVDSSIKEATIEWRNMNDGIPLWDTGADDWCDCQDYPNEYWKIITLNNFIYINDTVSFYWTWGQKNEMQYEMKAIKEDEKWRISYIQGFKFYVTVADYNKTMNK